ncbi:MAG TPA: hypothetical protein DCO79_10290, partial [Spirochaeta sp.]|nr:hypothetical protein [Spirochaeta sp.]
SEFPDVGAIAGQVVSKKSVKYRHGDTASAYPEAFFIHKAVTAFDIEIGAGPAVVDKITPVDSLDSRHPARLVFNVFIRDLFTAAFAASKAD